jgi:hypothetical protein
MRPCDRHRSLVALAIVTFGIGVGVVHGVAPTGRALAACFQQGGYNPRHALGPLRRPTIVRPPTTPLAAIRMLGRIHPARRQRAKRTPVRRQHPTRLRSHRLPKPERHGHRHRPTTHHVPPNPGRKHPTRLRSQRLPKPKCDEQRVRSATRGLPAQYTRLRKAAYLVSTGPELGIRQSRHMVPRDPLREADFRQGAVVPETVAWGRGPVSITAGRVCLRNGSTSAVTAPSGSAWTTCAAWTPPTCSAPAGS